MKINYKYIEILIGKILVGKKPKFYWIITWDGLLTKDSHFSGNSQNTEKIIFNSLPWPGMSSGTTFLLQILSFQCSLIDKHDLVWHVQHQHESLD